MERKNEILEFAFEVEILAHQLEVGLLLRHGEAELQTGRQLQARTWPEPKSLSRNRKAI